MNELFNNTEVAFSLKSDSELERAYFLFKLIKSEPLVKIGTAVTKFALKSSLPVEGLIRSTVFDHFCGGVSETDCMPIIEKMHDKSVYSVLDYSVEGKEEEAQFDSVLNKTLSLINFVNEKEAMPFAVFKPTGFGRFELYRKITEGEALNEKEKEEWERVVDRFEKVAKACFEKNECLLVDAEESWMQKAADDLMEDLMEKYNKEKVIVFSTLQLYRHDRLDYLKGLHQRAKKKGYKIGMKLVRGAYMEKERERAEEKKYLDPICATKEETDKNFNDVLKYMFDNIDDMAIFCGTHNEESSYLLMDLIEKAKMDKRDNRLWFGQLYGMSDNISFNLADQGFNVAKYLPFGPVKDVMPYLIRRAEENTSVAGQTNRELDLISKEKKRRKL
ncbi:proline dehydrogenase family protein [Lutimonas zeaxanthinifaciens]|uniref:proline dehydrogenase family protein n=1 Tax=Lutimonas zeaxanthinifaciens TaxID=3060215 RepID=UPI00265CD0C2|nr:proline dehydrogenase family protein [Lutimonas sp. YSD2104]WKK64734.1 proline dehydrogenase family protein [Lutimonas sp. YSD2104]